MKPTIFVGCSVESLPLAYTLQEQLQHHAQVQLWHQGTFKLSSNVLDDLLHQLEESDIGVFILSSDDLLKIRGKKYSAARDNVIFELGLFLGKLGKSRTFFLSPTNVKDFHLPSDLYGVISASYDQDQVKQNIHVALGPACNQIRETMQVSLANRYTGSHANLVRSELHRQIVNSFQLYKATLGALRGDLKRIRIHFLKYEEEKGTLKMLLQDDIYEDRNFSISVAEGVKHGVVICQASKNRKLVTCDLPENHASHYPDSEIPYSLRSVIAYPVRYKRSSVAGVISLDSEMTLAEFGIKNDPLRETFMKLCNLIEKLIQDHEQSIFEV